MPDFDEPGVGELIVPVDREDRFAVGRIGQTHAVKVFAARGEFADFLAPGPVPDRDGAGTVQGRQMLAVWRKSQSGNDIISPFLLRRCPFQYRQLLAGREVVEVDFRIVKLGSGDHLAVWTQGEHAPDRALGHGDPADLLAGGVLAKAGVPLPVRSHLSLSLRPK